MTMTTTLPQAADHTLPTRDGPVNVHGVLLGAGTSASDLHTHLEDTVAPGRKCRACRWSEVKIFRLVETERELSLRTHPSRTGSVADSLRLREAGPALGDYVVHTAGRSTVPGEFTKTRLVRTTDPRAVIEALVVERYEDGRLVDVFVSRPAQDALDDASDADASLDAAFDEWTRNPRNESILER